MSIQSSGPRELLCEMLRLFYEKGWVTGTGGGICGTDDAGRLLLAPSGVHKERVRPGDLFVMRDATTVIEGPGDETLTPSECAGVFCSVIERRAAGSVVHSHALTSVLATDLAGDALAIRGFEMLKGIRGVTNRETHLIPVIENTPRESELVAQVESVLSEERFEAAFCVLIRDHGAYIWGRDVWEAKRHAEVYHWLFEGVRERSR